MNAPIEDRTTATTPKGEQSGCLRSSLLTVLGGWILLATIVYQVMVWIQEQGLFEGAITSDRRWLMTLLYVAAVAIPAAVLMAAAQRRLRALGAAVLLAGLFVLSQAPARLAGISDAQAALVYQIGGCLLFLMAAGRMTSAYRQEVVRNPRATLLALALGGLVGLPWVLWGALGSPVDILLQALLALLFGRAVVIAIRPVLQSGANRTTNSFVTALLLMVMASGLGVNGSQWLLFLCLPAAAWALGALARAGSTSQVDERAVWLLAALVAFWPLAWIDPDELSMVVTLGPGELIQWAFFAAVVASVLAFAGGLVLMGIHRVPAAKEQLAVEERPVPIGWLAVMAAGVWLALLALYLVVGQPGLHGERLFVIFTSQADLTALAEIDDPQARREAAYQLLVANAESSQTPIRAVLDRLQIDYQPYYLENGLEVRGGPLLRLWLASRPEVEEILDSPVLRPLPAEVPFSQGSASQPQEPQWNLQMIGADRVWRDFGVTGAGIVVGQADSGVEGQHAELADSYRGRDGQDTYNWFDPWNHSTAPVDIGGHGTHTLGTVLGNTTGVAPDAQWIGCVNLARNLGNPALYLDCMQFLFAPFPPGGDPLKDGQPALGAQILNNSWGCPPVEGCDAQIMRAAVDALRAAGVFVVASAGNDGDGGQTCSSIRDPISMYDAVYSVGAVDSSGSLAYFSSVGPVQIDGSGRTKPDIAAPGVDVLSAYPGGTYEVASGTSMAGPHLVGVVALMWSANPDLIGDIEATEAILNTTAQPYERWLPDCVAPGRPNNAVGYGIVDAYAAVQAALGK